MELSDLDDNILLYNPTAGSFTSVQDAFNSTVDSCRILLDHYVISPNNCQLITVAISTITSITVCYRSYDPRDHLGTAAFVMVANKKVKHSLTAANWSPGAKADQSVYRSLLAGVDSIFSALTILVKQFNIKNGVITISLHYSTILKTCLPISPISIQMPSFDVLLPITVT